jgi:DNA gyrase subunit A
VRENRGDTMGNYHPHGEAGHLSHAGAHGRSRGRCASGWWTARATSVPSKAIAGGHALYRGALTHLGAALMEDMDKDTVDFVPNYDER